MKQFDTHRFALALKCQLLASRHKWLRLFAIFTLAMFMADLAFTRVFAPDYEWLVASHSTEEAVSLYSITVDQSVTFGYMFFGVAMLIGASSLFRTMRETRQRTTYLMWPVSNIEKYLVSLVYSIVLMGVGTVVAFVLADALRVLVDWMTGRVIVWGSPMVQQLFRGDDAPWQALLSVYSVMLWVHSLYILGGSLFRRHQFLMTSLCIVMGYLLLVLGWMNLEMSCGRSLTSSFDLDSVLFFNGVTFVSLLLTALNYWLSYRLFCRMQVINNRWLNL